MVVTTHTYNIETFRDRQRNLPVFSFCRKSDRTDLAFVSEYRQREMRG